MPGPRKLDNTSVEKVKPHTLASYRAAASKFVAYLDEHGFVPDGPEEWDDLLVERQGAHQVQLRVRGGCSRVRLPAAQEEIGLVPLGDRRVADGGRG